MDLTFEARDSRGNSCKIEKSFVTAPYEDAVLLTTDKAIYTSDQNIKGTVLTTAEDGTYSLDVIKHGQTLISHTVDVSDGEGIFSLPIP